MLPLLIAPKVLAAQVAVQGTAVSWAAAGGSSVDTITVSIVGGVFLVLAAAVPAWLNTRRPRPTGEDLSVKALVDSNNQRRREYSELSRKYDRQTQALAERDERIDKLETMCWQHGLNPHTGEQVASS
jgi:hypothetical protein